MQKIIVTIFFLISFACLKSLADDFELCNTFHVDSDLTLQTANGRIKGQCRTVPVSYSNNSKISYDVLSWLSIPYAEPPINESRFKNAMAVKTWTDVKDGTRLPNACLQPFFPVPMSEDCLYLNVYVRSDVYLNKNKTLNPILVFIHGGGLLFGSTRDSYLEPSTIVAMSGIIVVNINYRLNVFGFLRLDDTDSNGNQGFLDQSLALKWIHDNAQYFGGDPTKITIQGESAGAVSVGYHLLYPGSWPFFKNAIMQSGSSVIKALSLVSPSHKSQTARELFISLNCSSSLGNLDLLKCAKKIEASSILNLASQMDFRNNFGLLTIDGVAFNQSIDSLVKSGQVKKCKIFSGFNSDEYSRFLFEWPLGVVDKNTNYGYKGFKFSNFSNAINNYLLYYPTFPEKRASNVENEIINAYFKFSEIPFNLIYPVYLNYLNQIMSDYMMVCPAFQMAEIYSSLNLDAYVYEFKYRGVDSAIPKGVTHLGTATHVDDLTYTFGVPLSNKNSSIPNNYPTEDKIMAEKMLSYWLNFVKHEDPNYNNQGSIWRPFNKNLGLLSADEKMKNGNYFLIEKDSFKMVTDFSSHKCKTWNYTQNSNGINDSVPNIFRNLLDKIKIKLASLL